jgi:hypothetical protein
MASESDLKRITDGSVAGSIAVFVSAAAFAVFIWATLPIVAAVHEPWDDEGTYSISVLAITGLLLGFTFPFRARVVCAGAFCGQIVYLALATPDGLRSFLLLPLALWTLFLLLVWSALPAFAAAVGTALRFLVSGPAGRRYLVQLIVAWPARTHTAA